MDKTSDEQFIKWGGLSPSPGLDEEIDYTPLLLTKICTFLFVCSSFS